MPYELDKVDWRIINSLLEDARKTITQIAADAEISRPTAIKRLKRLRKNKVISLGAGVNVAKLGFKFALVTFKAEFAEANQKLEESLVACPRVFMVTETRRNTNFLALLYGENMETLVSVIDNFKSFLGMEIVSWHRSKQPLKVETFNLELFQKKRELAPCGRKCKNCSSYQSLECLGCPAVTEYRGPLLRTV